MPPSGCLLAGDKGLVLSPGDYGDRLFVKLDGEKEFVEVRSHASARKIGITLPRIHKRGYADMKHHYEWIVACKDRQQPYSSFETGAILTGIVLLGCIATRVNATIHCDAQSGKVVGPPEAIELASREYRRGWELA
jgi:hypothetical protein